ncbi:MAG: T9SS type A sorting domain-containing protein [Chitinophagaceae bacterium]|nr:MAG: T9SS type A sorting domain-containing protein [Chitinophagaceae bacterium]
MTKPLLTAACLLILTLRISAQACTASGDQNTYGTNDTWIGYVYDDMARTTYMGYVNEGTPGNPNFDQSFGGPNVNYPTHGCPVNTNTFGVRYKLQKNFTAGSYVITVGGDDGYRLSLDGGTTWAINRYTDQSYVITTITVTLSGPTSMILEYYENGSDNRVSFSLAVNCSGTENQAVYGASNTWYGYIYDGSNFDTYVGRVNEGAPANANFDESWGGANVSYNTSGCSVQTETFSARFRLQKTFTNKSVTFTIGGDDGFRLSIDGGTTWLINRWVAQSYTSSTATLNMNGTYNLVLEYYENTGDNRVSFSSVENIILPLKLISFTGARTSSGIGLNWKVLTDNETLVAEPQRSADGIHFVSLSAIKVPEPIPETWDAAYTDGNKLAGRTYYRLKLTGADGQVTYSTVIPFAGPNTTQGMIQVTVYPTVTSASGQLSLVANQRMNNVNMSIHDAAGRLVAQDKPGTLEDGQVANVMLSKYRLSAGLHFVTITTADGLSTVQKLVIR